MNRRGSVNWQDGCSSRPRTSPMRRSSCVRSTTGSPGWPWTVLVSMRSRAGHCRLNSRSSLRSAVHARVATIPWLLPSGLWLDYEAEGADAVQSQHDIDPSRDKDLAVQLLVEDARAARFRGTNPEKIDAVPWRQRD